MKFSDMMAKVTEATVTWQGETCQVGYKVGSITPVSLADMARLGSGEADGAGAPGMAERVAQSVQDVAREVARMVAWWDVEGDDGERLEATAETAATMPLSFLHAVIQTGQEAMRPPTARR